MRVGSIRTSVEMLRREFTKCARSLVRSALVVCVIASGAPCVAQEADPPTPPDVGDLKVYGFYIGELGVPAAQVDIPIRLTKFLTDHAQRHDHQFRIASYEAYQERSSGGSGEQEPKAVSESDLAETAKRLSNPISDVWALFSHFELTFADGDVNSGDSKVGADMIFQPILPLPLYGDGAKRWNFIMRPTIPVVFSQPVPTGLNTFDHKGGLGDIQLPTVIVPPTGNWLLGAGPAFLFPTSTDDAFGRRQWGVGPAAVVGYSTKAATVGVFGQYYFGIGSRGAREPGVRDASYGSLLYFVSVNLPNAWQFGFNPTITYDARASSGNRWNVPVGLMVAKTTLLGKLPVKFNFGVEYSVVSENAYGRRAALVLEVVPVIPNLIRRPILGR
jgi:hypothetical protein